MKNDQDFTEELGHSMPSSKRETEEDMLEELCSLAKKDARITIPEICGRMEMTRREVLAYLKQLSARGYVKTEENKRCLPIRKHRGAREKRYSFGYAVFLILALMK